MPAKLRQGFASPYDSFGKFFVWSNALAGKGSDSGEKQVFSFSAAPPKQHWIGVWLRILTPSFSGMMG